jgi:hypothetical protein
VVSAIPQILALGFDPTRLVTEVFVLHPRLASMVPERGHRGRRSIQGLLGVSTERQGFIGG